LSKEQGSKGRVLALRYDEPRTRLVRSTTQEKGRPSLATVKEEGPDSRRIGRAPFNHERTHPDGEGNKEETKYETELKEIKKALQKELWGYKAYSAASNSNYRSTDHTTWQYGSQKEHDYQSQTTKTY
jgi:hypothetical protein